MTLLKIKQIDHLCILTLNRPEKRNALNQALLQELFLTLQNLKHNPEIHGVILTGEGPSFCAGADIEQLRHGGVEEGYHIAQQGQAVFEYLETLGKPSLAAIHGFALGGGCELALAATLRIASIDAKFGQPEIKLGIIPGYGGTQRLSRLIGKSRALELCLTGRMIDAETAQSWGLIQQITSSQDLLQTALKTLSEICAMPTVALQAILDVIHRGYELPLHDALHLEALQFARTCGTEDKNEGIDAFLEKRNPQFKGR